MCLIMRCNSLALDIVLKIKVVANMYLDTGRERYMTHDKFRQCLESKIFQCKQHVTVHGTLLLNVAMLPAKICTGKLARKYLWYVLGWCMYMKVFPLVQTC